MKSIGKYLIGMVIGGSLAAGFLLLHAQTAGVGGFNNDLAPVQPAGLDSIVRLSADLQGLALMSPADLPRSGTFFVIVPGYGGGVTALPYPCITPALAGLPVYGVTGNAFLVDATIGQTMANPPRAGRMMANRTVESALEAQANTVLNLIARVQTAAAGRQMRTMGMNYSGGPLPGDVGGGGGTNGFDYGLTRPVYTTNDLWLEITGKTNTTAYLTIHPPWNVTNGVYDLFATTNLFPDAWQWILRCEPGQTNLVVTNLTASADFFILGLTNDSDGGGLSDAYERLVLHTDPDNADSSGDGIPDGWEAALGLDPLLNNPARGGERLNYGYTLADWWNGVSGVKGGAVDMDNEGNVLSVTQ